MEGVRLAAYDEVDNGGDRYHDVREDVGEDEGRSWTMVGASTKQNTTPVRVMETVNMSWASEYQRRVQSPRVIMAKATASSRAIQRFDWMVKNRNVLLPSLNPRELW